MLSRLWRSGCIFQSQSLILQKIVAYSYKKEMYCQIFELLNGKKHKVVMNSEVESHNPVNTTSVFEVVVVVSKYEVSSVICVLFI